MGVVRLWPNFGLKIPNFAREIGLLASEIGASKAIRHASNLSRQRLYDCDAKIDRIGMVLTSASVLLDAGFGSRDGQSYVSRSINLCFVLIFVFNFCLFYRQLSFFSCFFDVRLSRSVFNIFHVSAISFSSSVVSY